MKFGVNTFIWTSTFDKSNVPLLPTIKEHGFDGVEVPCFRARDFAAADIRKGVQANGLECTVCSVLPQGFSLISEDREIRSKTVVHMRECIQAVAEAGARVIA